MPCACVRRRSRSASASPTPPWWPSAPGRSPPGTATHRVLIVVLLGLAAVTGTAVALMPTERILRSRWREPFFLTWSLADVALIGVMAAADGGARSPTTLMFFLTLVFSAL